MRRRVPQVAGLKRIDPRDIDLLRKFVTEQGKIVPARLTGASPRLQREIARAVRRARTMGLLR
jgi:small subunit ribosomal protein S18